VRDVTGRKQAQAALERSAQEVRDLSARILNTQETERRNLALELHDELGQALTAIKISLQTRGRFAEAQRDALDAQTMQTVERTIAQVRALSLQLRPSVLDDLGLAPALEWLVAQRNQAGTAIISLHVDRPPERLPAELETAAFRIVQEALTNALRHAHAQQVSIRLGGDAYTLAPKVQDDGRGFDASALHRGMLSGKSLGLIGMQERAALVGGQLQVVASPGDGCSVEFTCPIETLELAPA